MVFWPAVSGFGQLVPVRVIIGLAGLNASGVQKAEFPVSVCPEQVGIGILIRPVGEAGAVIRHGGKIQADGRG